MNCLFMRRGYPEDAGTPVTVTMTGTGSTTYGYLVYNGVTYYSAGSFNAVTGDTITFCIRGKYYAVAYVNINGTDVFTESSDTLQAYGWTIPDGISSVNVSFTIGAAGGGTGRITVTTA